MSDRTRPLPARYFHVAHRRGPDRSRLRSRGDYRIFLAAFTSTLAAAGMRLVAYSLLDDDWRFVAGPTTSSALAALLRRVTTAHRRARRHRSTPAGEFDVSVLGMQALGGVLAVKAGADSGLLGILAATAACAFLGAVQGGIIARVRVQSMAFTIGTYIALLGLTNVIAGNETLTFTNTNASIWINQTVENFFSPRSLIALGVFALVMVVCATTRIGPRC
mgnify:CR=1 FL=1